MCEREQQQREKTSDLQCSEDTPTSSSNISFNFIYGYNNRYQETFRRKLLNNVLNHKNVYFSRAYDHYMNNRHRESLNDYILGLIVLYYKTFKDFLDRFENVSHIIYPIDRKVTASITDNNDGDEAKIIRMFVDRYKVIKEGEVHVVSSQIDVEHLVLCIINRLCRIAKFYSYFPLLDELIIYIDPVSHLRVYSSRPFGFGNSGAVLCDAILMIADALSILKNKI